MFNIKDRGYVKKGAFVDIIIFNLNNMRDYPDIFTEKPMVSSGVEYLLINGELVIKNGKLNEIRAGKIIINF